MAQSVKSSRRGRGGLGVDDALAQREIGHRNAELGQEPATSRPARRIYDFPRQVHLPDPHRAATRRGGNYGGASRFLPKEYIAARRNARHRAANDDKTIAELNGVSAKEVMQRINVFTVFGHAKITPASILHADD